MEGIRGIDWGDAINQNICIERRNGLFLPRIRETEMGYNCKDMRTCWVVGTRDFGDDEFWFLNSKMPCTEEMFNFEDLPVQIFTWREAIKERQRCQMQKISIEINNLYNLWRK